MQDHWSFIEEAAAELGVTAEQLRKWRIRGVAHAFRLRIIKIAQRRHYPLDWAAFDEPPGKRAVAELSGS